MPSKITADTCGHIIDFDFIEGEKLEIENSWQVLDHQSLCRYAGFIIFLIAFVGLCIPASCEEDADHWIKEGYKLKWKGLFDQANESFQKALDIYSQKIISNPNDFNATSKKSLLLARLNRTDEAMQTLHSAVEADPDNPAAWKMMGFALIVIAEIRQAEEGGAEKEVAGMDDIYSQSLQAFQRAVDLDRDDAEAWRGRALAHLGLGEWDEARIALDRSIEIDPRSAQAWLDRGILLLEMGRAEEAISALDRALAIQPDNLDALSTKAEALTILGRYQEAEAAFDQAMDLDSGKYETGDSYVDWQLSVEV